MFFIYPSLHVPYIIYPSFICAFEMLLEQICYNVIAYSHTRFDAHILAGTSDYTVRTHKSLALGNFYKVEFNFHKEINNKIKIHNNYVSDRFYQYHLVIVYR